MARSLYQTLIRTSQAGLLPTKPPPTPYAPRLVTLRAQSIHSEDSDRLDSNPADSDAEQQREALAVQRIEDAIHRIIVMRSAPDWLPFVPGSSYWVPPRRKSHGIAELVDKLANSLTQEEVMSLTTSRGWPSSAFFVNDASPDSADVEMTSRNISRSEHEDA